MPEMKECFSGEPLTQWDGSRNMTPKEDFYYIDPDGKNRMLLKEAVSMEQQFQERFGAR